MPVSNIERFTQYMPIIVQQDATIYSLFISVNRSTCFEWYLYPSSGALVTVSTASYMPIIVQQDATIYSLFISVNRSTCFEWYLHPSSGAHIAVSTVFVIIQTVTATCRELMSTTSNSKRSKNSRMFKHREKTNDWIYYDTVYYDAVKVNKRKYVLLAYPGTISTLCFYI